MRTSFPAWSHGGRGILLLLLWLGLLGSAVAQTPVARYGALRVSGNRIVGAANTPVSLAGNSLFWSNAGWGGEKYYTANTVNWLRNSWNASVVRVAMGVDESGGYLENPAREKAKVKTVVDAAIAAGMYVIIDWHSHHAESYQSQAIAFFQEMARTYGNQPHVIYEIYNEPLQVSWSGVVKPYAVAVAGAIRAIDPDNLIIVGTPTWSQDVDVAAADPITQYPNIAYTLHFYAATHKAGLRSKAATALSRGVALFVTEYGTTEASGNGYIDAASTQEWMTFLQQNSISHANWSLNDKSEASSALVPGTSPTAAWSDNFLTTSGRLVKGYIQNWGGNTPPPPTPTGTVVQAESYHVMSGVQTETTTDTGGGLNVGWIDAGDWMAYTINVPSAGAYTFQFRVASLNGGGSIRLEQNAGTTFLGTVAVPSTGGWQNWTTISLTVNLNAGQQDIAIGVPAGGYNINWFSFAPVGARAAAPTATALALYPNPASEALRLTLPAAPQAGQLTVYSAWGKPLLTQAVAQGTTSVELPLARLPRGNYTLRLQLGDAVSTHRFVKE